MSIRVLAAALLVASCGTQHLQAPSAEPVRVSRHTHQEEVWPDSVPMGLRSRTLVLQFSNGGLAYGLIMSSHGYVTVQAPVSNPCDALGGISQGGTVAWFDVNLTQRFVPCHELVSLSPLLPQIREEEHLDVDDPNEPPSRARLLASAPMPGLGQVLYRGTDDAPGWIQMGLWATGLVTLGAIYAVQGASPLPLNDPRFQTERATRAAVGLTGFVFVAGSYLWSWIDAVVEAVRR